MECLNCGKKVSRANQRYCNDACRMSFKRKGEQKPEQDVAENPNKPEQKANTNTKPEHIEWCASDVSDKENVYFQGKKLSELDPEQFFKIGEVWFKVRDLRWWMLHGVLDRGELPSSKGVRMGAGDKRKAFRELMYQYDVRFGARDKDFNLIAMM